MKKLTLCLFLLAFLCTAKAESVHSSYLTADPDYGHIYPFVQEIGWDMVYGFCDAQGQQVTDAIYTTVERLPLGDGFFYAMETWNESGEPVWQYASADGSIVSEPCFSQVSAVPTGFILCMRPGETPVFELLNEQFRICAIELDFQISGQQLVPKAYMDGRYICSCPGGDVLIDESKKMLHIGTAQMEFDRYGDVILTNGLGWQSALNPENELIEVEGCNTFLGFSRLNEESILVTLQGPECRIVDPRGQVLWEDIHHAYIGWGAGFMTCTDPADPEALYRNFSRDGRLLLSGSGKDYANWRDLGFGMYFSRPREGQTVIRNFADGTEQIIPCETYQDVLWASESAQEAVCASYMCGDGHLYLVMPDGEILTADPMHLNFLYDPITEEGYFLTYDEGEDMTTLRAADYHTELFRFRGWCSIADGILTACTQEECTLYRMDGSVLFTYTYPEGMG